jgi:hypothetical protein
LTYTTSMLSFVSIASGIFLDGLVGYGTIVGTTAIAYLEIIGDILWLLVSCWPSWLVTLMTLHKLDVVQSLKSVTSLQKARSLMGHFCSVSVGLKKTNTLGQTKIQSIRKKHRRLAHTAPIPTYLAILLKFVSICFTHNTSCWHTVH